MKTGRMTEEQRAASVKRGMLVVALFSLIAPVGILAMVLNHQTRWRDKILNSLDAKWTAFYEVPPRRGSIRARGGSILAISEKSYELILDPTIVGDAFSVVDRLDNFIEADKFELLERIQKAKAEEKKYLPVSNGLGQAQMTEIANMNLRGVFLRPVYQRYYPFREQMAPHMVGFVRDRDGVHFQSENAFDDKLTGKPGRIYYQRNSKWGKIPNTTYVDERVSNGRDVYLTIDENIQIVSEIELDRAMAENRSEWGLIAVMDPYTGEILANAVRPTFDPNSCVQGGAVDKVAANPLYGFVVEPGSIIKPIVVAGAIDRGYIRPDDKYYCPQKFKVKNITITEANKEMGYGWLTVNDGMVRSSNICMAQVGMDIGLNRMMEIFNGSLLFDKPGLGLPTETAGIPPEHAKKDKRGLYPEIYDTDEATAAFGQGIAVSPLAILSAYAEIANGGYAVQPKILLGTANDIGGVVGNVDKTSANYVAHNPAKSKRLARKRVYSEETAEIMRKMLTDVVNSENGTGKRARLSSGMTAAGKTGTAQVAGRYGAYAKGQYLASFVGFFPAENPKYLVLVMFMKPRGKIYGGELAAPVFASVADRICYLDRMNPEDFLASSDSGNKGPA